ncbi:hypothetical protein H8R18_00575 [Nanchangia anserum]|uniref:C-deglycosylation enzyme beta subunit n=1 Tax=Nanchangia anserum TaxID=2692125 RepID=A0A8I0GCQ1_9ACTO|nr:DUF6379 domain-containing protein [Nanchangia anserum]MBD3689740.1 hypothetical protein [Nanchangia anserum]QOX81911.1 hypothetical protein H8R18_00575 [Nanchangia anserum]
MFNDLIVKDGSVRNLSGEREGFAFETHIAYYRGLGLSMVETPRIVIDGEEIAGENVTFTLHGKTRTFAELAHVYDERWELREFATVGVAYPGGLAAGEHTLEVTQTLRVSYLPILSQNTVSVRFTID